MQRKPVFLHMRCIRLFGHAGADVQSAYLEKEEIAAMEASDPLLLSAGLLLGAGLLRSGQILDIYMETGEATASVASEVAQRPKLASRRAVEASLIPLRRSTSNGRTVTAAERRRCGGDAARIHTPGKRGAAGRGFFVEPIALYMTRDLHQPGDDLWRFRYRSPQQGEPIRLGEFAQHGAGTDLCILSYGNGYYYSRQAAKVLQEIHGIDLRVIDLRWLAPLDEDNLLAAVAACRRILIVDECRGTGSQSEALSALLNEHCDWYPRLKRLAGADCFIPLGPAATLPLPGKDAIVRAAVELMAEQ